MTDILDTARKYVRDADAREYAERDISPTSAQTYAICRALIARTEALRECMDCMDSLRDFVAEGGSRHMIGATGAIYAADAAMEAARKTLAEEP